MPKIKYRPARDIPKAVRELKNFSPTDIREWILRNYNKAITKEAVSNWMRRHPEVIEPLKKEIAGEDIEEEEMTLTVFESGTFELFPKVRKWDLLMRRDKIQNRVANVGTLKRICQGIKPRIDPLTQKQYKRGVKKATGAKGIDLKMHGWVLQHPERLDIDTFNKWQDLMIEFYPQVDTSLERMAVRNFFSANGIQVGRQISGRKHKSAGKYARLFVEKPILDNIFNDLKRSNFEAYVVDRFMFKTGTRISATLEAKLQNIRAVEGVYDIRIYDKAVRSIHPEGKPWDKFISSDLLEDIKALTDYPENKAGAMFTLTDQEMSDVNKEMLQKHYPELWEQFPDYDDHNHFWRHMFAQHMLRRTGWNYGIVAALGGWDVKSLEESYGKPPQAIVKKWGKELVIDL